MHYELVVSDVGGVVIEYNADQFVHQVSVLLHRPFETVQEAIYHKELLLPLELGRISPTAYFTGLKKKLKLPWTYEQFVGGWNSIFMENRDVAWILQRLHKWHKLTALTNTNQLHIEHLRRTVPALEVFDDWVVSCEVGLRKPDPDIYRLALERAGVRAERAVFIDDRPEMVDAARGVGLKGVRFENSRQLEQDLQSIGLNM